MADFKVFTADRSSYGQMGHAETFSAVAYMLSQHVAMGWTVHVYDDTADKWREMPVGELIVRESQFRTGIKQLAVCHPDGELETAWKRWQYAERVLHWAEGIRNREDAE